MKRKFKTLGLVLAAVFALSALSASAASAATVFHSAVASQNVVGAQVKGSEHVFTTHAGTVRCSIATFEGEAAATTTSATQTLTPNYDSCEAFFFVNVPIHENGCAYIFNANGTTDVECPAGKSIEITAPGCVTKVGEQHLASGMTYHNVTEGGKKHITATTSVSGIEYDECGEATSNGTYTGQTTVKGASGGISVE